MSKFSVILKEKRKAKGYSQKALGNLLGIGQTTIANYESGAREPNHELITKISYALETSIDELLGGDLGELESNSKTNIHRLDAAASEALKDEFLQALLEKKEAKAMKMFYDYELEHESYILILEKVIRETLYQVGIMWAEGLIDVAKEHYISNIILKVLSALSLRQQLTFIPTKKEKILCMTYSSDDHTIGSRIADAYLKELGYETVYIGNNIPTNNIVEVMKQESITTLAISLTIESYVDGLKNFIRVLRSHFPDQTLRIIVGGQGVYRYKEAPNELGADGWSDDFQSMKALLTDS
jgi:methanogenic corrinoid protein MtbC1/DNA-binding XRE family transcriptional regulator